MTTNYLAMVAGVRVIAPYGLEVTFTDGVIRRISLERMIAQASGPVFGPLRDPALFAQAYYDAEGYTVAWPTGADIAPEALYSDFDPLP